MTPHAPDLPTSVPPPCSRRSVPKRRFARSSAAFGTAALMLLVVASGVSGASSIHSPAPAVGTAVPRVLPTWSPVSILGAHPPGLQGAVMAYDAADGYVVLFGGANVTTGGATVLSNATWTYHAGIWIKLRPTTAPSPREYPSLTYDPVTHALLLFGGLGNTNVSSPMYLNDTWSFHRGSWTHLHHTGAPPARYGAVLAYDPTIPGAVLGGGVGVLLPSGKGNETDEWVFANGSWTQFLGKEDFGGKGASLAYSPAGRSLVYFGPCGTPTTGVFHTGSWSPLTFGKPGGPSGVCFAPFVNDPRLGTLVLFEAQNGGSSTWGYHGGWTNLTPTRQPGLRFGPVAAYDGSDGYVVLFGGRLVNGPQLMHDTWALT